MLYASATHPPTSRDLEPYWQVGEWRWPLPPPTHLPVGKTPLVGVLPYYSVGRTQKPLSHKLTPSSLPPYSMFMTEVTSMGLGGSDNCAKSGYSVLVYILLLLPDESPKIRARLVENLLLLLVCVRTPRDCGHSSCCVLPREFADGAGYRRTDRTGQRCTHLLCRSCHHRHVVSWRSPLRGDGQPAGGLHPPHRQRGEHQAGGV